VSAAPTTTSGPPQRIGVLGGTFDPPHLAHLAAGAAARATLRLDRVIFVTAGEPWRKAARPVTAAPLRLRLLRAALAPLGAWAEASGIEVERRGPSYTADTLAALGQERPADAWWFVLGADALADLPHWHRPDAIVRRARLAVVGRPGEPESLPPSVRDAVPGIEEAIDRVSMPRLAISSSELRERVRRGRSTAPLLPAEVRRLIDELGLYR
jgi:nicotinate-nucleotide adenylyltransferase